MLEMMGVGVFGRVAVNEVEYDWERRGTALLCVHVTSRMDKNKDKV